MRLTRGMRRPSSVGDTLWGYPLVAVPKDVAVAVDRRGRSGYDPPVERAFRRRSAPWAPDFPESVLASGPLVTRPGARDRIRRIHLLACAPPEVQHSVADAEGAFARTVCHWPGMRLVGEIDGRGKCQRAASEAGRDVADIVMAEKDRENRIRRTGRDVARWDWAFARDPGRLRRLLLGAGVPLARGHRGADRDYSQRSVMESPAADSNCRSVETDRPTTAFGSPSTPRTKAAPRPSMVKPPAQGSGSPVAT